MKEDRRFEYIAQPVQKRFRFRNHIKYNSLSMRGPEIDSQAKVILGFGDSVLNGGVLTEQDSLASIRLSKSLSELKGSNIQFLNISSGSWGPDNCFAYLNHYGNFDAFKIYLVVSSHDAYDNMDFKSIVGIHKSFPDEQYKIAIVELIDRYILPKFGLGIKKPTELGISKKDHSSEFNTGFASFLDYSNSHNIPLVIYLHADLKELKNLTYNDEGQKIIQWSEENKVPLIQDLNQGLTKNHFRDAIHFNESGQKLMAQLILNYESIITN